MALVRTAGRPERTNLKPWLVICSFVILKSLILFLILKKIEPNESKKIIL